jgi:hypothetical protein
MRFKLFLAGAFAAVLSCSAQALTLQEFNELAAYAGNMVNSSEGNQDLTLVALGKSKLLAKSDATLVKEVKSILQFYKFDRKPSDNDDRQYVETVVRNQKDAIASLKRYYAYRDGELMREGQSLLGAILAKGNYQIDSLSTKNLRKWLSGSVNETRAPYISSMSSNFLQELVAEVTREKVFATLNEAQKVIFVEVGFGDDDDFASKGIAALFQSQDGEVYALIGEVVWT